MTDSPSEIQLIPIDSITVLNPRARNKKVFGELVTSIAHLGLKKPITVSRREGKSGYDLVCGQGRLEAYVALGQIEIPAVIINVSEEDCYIMSLVENLARRKHSSLELMQEIGSLRERGYSMNEIAAKVDFGVEYIKAICHLLDHGEDRLLAAVDRGVIPHSIALEICRAKETEVQQALTEAYERKTIPGNQILAIRRIIEERNRTGKGVHAFGGIVSHSSRPVTSVVLVRAYQRETERQKLLVKKAAVAQTRLIFVINALRQLMADDHFVTLLRAEAIHTIPRPLAIRLGLQAS
jgi:ParB family transcriptional regulator, chromosome partitioning protein